jgi:hypothetical protein
LFIHHDVLAGVVGPGTLDAPDTSSTSSVLMLSFTASVKNPTHLLYQFGKQQQTNNK